MAEQDHAEGEATFTPAIEAPEVAAPTAETEQAPPFELSAEEFALMQPPHQPEDPEVKALMEAKGMPYDSAVRVNVDGNVFKVSTTEDFGTRLDFTGEE